MGFSCGSSATMGHSGGRQAARASPKALRRALEQAALQALCAKGNVLTGSCLCAVQSESITPSGGTGAGALAGNTISLQMQSIGAAHAAIQAWPPHAGPPMSLKACFLAGLLRTQRESHPAALARAPQPAVRARLERTARVPAVGAAAQPGRAGCGADRPPGHPPVRTSTLQHACM